MNVRPAPQPAWFLSLLIHALPLLGWWWLANRLPEPRPQTQLTLELVGMVTERQVEAQAPEPPPPEERPPEQKREPRPVPKPRKVDPDTVKLPPEPEVREVAEVPPPPPPPSIDPKPEAQVAQKLATSEDEQAAIRRYVAGLSKALQRKLVYPQGARGAGAIGAPTIAFTLTENGGIEPDTLKVYKSSGFALLDESALQAARDAVPFQAPPKRMNIVVAVSFAEIH